MLEPEYRQRSARWCKTTLGFLRDYFFIKFFKSMTIQILQKETEFRSFLCFVDLHPCIIFFQMKPVGCTLLLSIFISTSLRVSGNYVPIIRRLAVSMRHWYFSLCMGGQQTRQPPIQSKKSQCRIDTASSADDGHIVERNM